MYSGRLVFSQVMDHLPMKTFHRCVQRYCCVARNFVRDLSVYF